MTDEGTPLTEDEKEERLLTQKRDSLRRRLLHAAEACNEKAITCTRDGAATDEKVASAAMRWATACAILIDKFRLESGEGEGKRANPNANSGGIDFSRRRQEQLRRDAAKKLPPPSAVAGT